jgi:hypothetical protein
MARQSRGTTRAPERVPWVMQLAALDDFLTNEAPLKYKKYDYHYTNCRKRGLFID